MSETIRLHEIYHARKSIRMGMQRVRINPNFCTHQGTPRRISRNVTGVFPINDRRGILGEHQNPEAHRYEKVVECAQCETILEAVRKV